MTKSLDGVGEIKEHGETCLIDSVTGIASFLSGAGCHVTGNKVTESRITTLELVVTILLRNLGRLDFLLTEFHHIFHLLGNPNTSVVTERL